MPMVIVRGLIAPQIKVENGNNLIRGDAPGPKRLRSTDIGLTLRRGPPGAPKTGEVQVAGRQRQPRGIIGERAQAVEE